MLFYKFLFFTLLHVLNSAVPADLDLLLLLSFTIFNQPNFYFFSLHASLMKPVAEKKAS